MNIATLQCAMSDDKMSDDDIEMMTNTIGELADMVKEMRNVVIISDHDNVARLNHFNQAYESLKCLHENLKA